MTINVAKIIAPPSRAKHSRRRIACPEAQDYANNTRLHQRFSMAASMNCRRNAKYFILTMLIPIGTKYRCLSI
jgi:hypothetical protein